MRTLAVVPIKTLSAAKTRLSGALATGARMSLMQAMFSDVLGSLRHTPSVDAIAVVTVDAIELDALLVRSALTDLQVAIVSDRGGTGTNALVLSPPDAMTPSFGPGSFERHVALAESAGLRYSAEPAPSLEHDVDTPDDLAALALALDGARTVAPRTRGALRQLQRSGAIREGAGDLVRV
jgi:2-phospho-L-lactate guanylyltransferase